MQIIYQIEKIQVKTHFVRTGHQLHKEFIVLARNEVTVTDN